MRALIAGAAIALLFDATVAAAQGRHTRAAQADLDRIDKEQRIARARLRSARALDRVVEAGGTVVDPDTAGTTLPALAPAPVQPAGSPLVTPADTPAGSLTPVQTARAIEQVQHIADLQRTLAVDKAAQEFGGVELGAGFSLTFDVGRNKRIGTAQIVDGIVRVTDQNNTPARLLLESHYFFKPRFTGPFGLPEDMWGIGPFVAVQPGDERIIEAIGLGMMIGFRREETRSNSFNIGVGVMIDPDTRILGDGFAANAPPPGGEEEIRYRETSQVGVMVLTSFSF